MPHCGGSHGSPGVEILHTPSVNCWPAGQLPQSPPQDPPLPPCVQPVGQSVGNATQLPFSSLYPGAHVSIMQSLHCVHSLQPVLWFILTSVQIFVAVAAFPGRGLQGSGVPILYCLSVHSDTQCPLHPPAPQPVVTAVLPVSQLQPGIGVGPPPKLGPEPVPLGHEQQPLSGHE